MIQSHGLHSQIYPRLCDEMKKEADSMRRLLHDSVFLRIKDSYGLVCLCVEERREKGRLVVHCDRENEEA